MNSEKSKPAQRNDGRRPPGFSHHALFFLLPDCAADSGGKLSPEAEGYKKTVEDRLGPLWYHLTEAYLNSLHVGTVQTIFEIPAASGQVRNVRVTSTTGNRIDELIARRAIDQLRAPPIPAAILAQIDHDYLVIEEAFTIFDNANPPPSPAPSKKG